jgi:tetratricopeptide (TPR) repeat protein
LLAQNRRSRTGAETCEKFHFINRPNRVGSLKTAKVLGLDLPLGDHQTGIDYFQRALRLSPLDPRIFYAQAGLAYAYFFLGSYEKGLKCAATALRHHANHVPALRVAMACNALSGKIEAAQKLWRQVALLSPSDRVSETRKRSGYRDQELAKLRKPIA